MTPLERSVARWQHGIDIAGAGYMLAGLVVHHSVDGIYLRELREVRDQECDQGRDQGRDQGPEAVSALNQTP